MNISIQTQGSSVIHSACPVGSPNPAEMPLPPQDTEERNALISTEEWRYSLDMLLPEMALEIFSYVLLDLPINKILDVTEYKKGILIPEAWPAIYKAYSFLFTSHNRKSSWCYQLKKLQNIINDAQTFGGKTLRQTFYGLNLARDTESSIPIEDFMLAGIISRELLHPDNIPLSVSCQQRFLEWLCRKKARVVACLRWLPAQKSKPDLLKEAAKYKDLYFFREVSRYSTIHKLYGKTLPYKNALFQAISNNDIALAKYIFYKNPHIQIPTPAFHIAAVNGHLEMIKFLIAKGSDIQAIGPIKENVLGMAIEFFFPYGISSLQKESEEYQKIINQTNTIIFLLQQYEKKGISIEREWKRLSAITLLHMACYIQDPESSLWLAKFMIKKDKNFIHAKDLYGNTPLHCAEKEKNDHMIKFLRENIKVGSKTTAQQKGGWLVSMGQSIHNMYVRLFAAVTFIPRTFYTMCRNAIHSFLY